MLTGGLRPQPPQHHRLQGPAGKGGLRRQGACPPLVLKLTHHYCHCTESPCLLSSKFNAGLRNTEMRSDTDQNTRPRMDKILNTSVTDGTARAKNEQVLDIFECNDFYAERTNSSKRKTSIGLKCPSDTPVTRRKPGRTGGSRRERACHPPPPSDHGAESLAEEARVSQSAHTWSITEL